MSVVTVDRPQPSPQRGRTAWLSVAAISGASLLGLGLAYLACMLLIPASSGASLFPGYDRLEEIVCFSGNSSKPRQSVSRDE